MITIIIIKIQVGQMETIKEQNVNFEEYVLRFRRLIKSLGLNNSSQREQVLKVLFESSGHLRAEDIAYHIKEQYKHNIGIATVYRILNFLEDLKIVKGILIDGKDGKVYELNILSHHDHLVCIECGKIVEFYDSELERLQELISNEKGFVLESHDMILYGICKECQDE